MMMSTIIGGYNMFYHVITRKKSSCPQILVSDNKMRITVWGREKKDKNNMKPSNIDKQK